MLGRNAGITTSVWAAVLTFSPCWFLGFECWGTWSTESQGWCRCHEERSHACHGERWKPAVSKVPPVRKDTAVQESQPKKDSSEDLDTSNSSAVPAASETVASLDETESEQDPEHRGPSALHTRAAVVPTLPVVEELRLAPSVTSLGSLPSSCFELSSSNLDLHK